MSGRDTRTRAVTLFDALESVTAKANPKSPLTLSPTDERARSLAEPLPLSFPSTGKRAARNGYAMGPPQASAWSADAPFSVLGTLSPGGPLDAHGEPLPSEVGSSEVNAATRNAPSPHVVWRVETGAFLPPEADRVVDVADGVLVGTALVRFQSLPPAGSGVLTTEPDEITVPAGVPLDERLRSLLLYGGAEEALVWPKFTVAIVAFGDELIAQGTSPLPHTQWELSCTWLEEAVEALGLDTVFLGIRPDAPQGMDALLFRAAERGVRVVLAVGGLGNGATDRTAEGLRRAEAHVHFERVKCEGLENLLFAKTMGLEIIGLSGRPLEAAAGFDLIARPALAHRLGAPAPLWDWRPSEGVALQADAGIRWQLVPCGADGQADDTCPASLPCAAGQDGWILRALGLPDTAAPGSGSQEEIVREWHLPQAAR